MSSISEELEAWSSFGECLLHTVSSQDALSSVEVVINSIRERGSTSVRHDVLERPLLVTLRIDAVSSISYLAQSSEGMTPDPGVVGWGLSEFALLEVIELVELQECMVRIRWEGDHRVLEIRGRRTYLEQDAFGVNDPGALS